VRTTSSQILLEQKERTKGTKVQPFSQQEVRRLMILAMRPNKEYMASDIAETLGMPSRRIVNNFTWLVEKGLVVATKHKRTYGARSYRLNLKEKKSDSE